MSDVTDMSKEEEKKLNELFNKLDVNKDGQIDIHDLTQALSDMQVPQLPGHAKVKFQKHVLQTLYMSMSKPKPSSLHHVWGC